MNYNEALAILNLKSDYTEEELKELTEIKLKNIIQIILKLVVQKKKLMLKKR